MDAKEPPRADSIDDHNDILKGDIVLGVIAGEDVRHATDYEHEMGFMQALKLYPTAVCYERNEGSE